MLLSVNLRKMIFMYLAFVQLLCFCCVALCNALSSYHQILLQPHLRVLYYRATINDL